MVEVLQRFSTGNLSMLLGILLISWMVWPILCGVLGSRRGMGLQGVTHGLLWGPLGLVPVLLSRKKHVCPTCGERTMLEQTTAHTIQSPLPTAVVAPPVVETAFNEIEPAFNEIDPAELDEQERLRAWINQ